jgi:hypothetical protein
MATTPLTTQAVTYAGLTPSFTAAGGAGAGNGFTFTNDGSTYFRIKNASGSQITCTIKGAGYLGGILVADQTFTVAATTGDVTMKCDPAYFGATTTVEVSAATSITAAVFK